MSAQVNLESDVIDDEFKKKVAEQTEVTRFGVETPIDAEDKPTLEARKWFQWWGVYVQKVLTE